MVRPTSCFVLAGALVECGDALGGDGRRPVAPVGRVVVQEHPPLAPVEHVDDDDDVALAASTEAMLLPP